MVDTNGNIQQAAERDRRRIDRLRLALEAVEADYAEPGAENKSVLSHVIRQLSGELRLSELNREKLLAMIPAHSPVEPLTRWNIAYYAGDQKHEESQPISADTSEAALARFWELVPTGRVTLVQSIQRGVHMTYNPPRGKDEPVTEDGLPVEAAKGEGKPLPDFSVSTDWIIEYENGAYPHKCKATTGLDALLKFWQLFPGRAVISLYNPLNDWRIDYDPPLRQKP